MIETAKQTIKVYGLLPAGERVTAAVSGGADSVALLRFLCILRQDGWPFTLTAAHLHHGLRGEEADRDEQFVRQLCAAWEVPLTVGHCDVQAERRRTGEGVEECARRLRYAFLQDVSEGLIATAHTRNDAAETLLLHLVRGSGLPGLCGIAPKRGRLIRPLLDCARAQVESFLQQEGISYVTDSSNADQYFSRNRVRIQILPVLEQLNPAFLEAVGRTLVQNRRDEAFLSQTAAQALERLRKEDGFDASALAALPEAIQSRVLRAACQEKTGQTLDFEKTERLAGLLERGGRTGLSGGMEGVVYAGRLFFRPTAALAQAAAFSIPAVLGENRVPGRCVRLCLRPVPEGKIHNLFAYALIDYDKIRGELTLRSRLSGDRLSLRQRGCTKTLKKLFQEAHIPPERRQSLLILADEEGVVWVEGFGPHARVALTDCSQRALAIEILEGSTC